MTAFDNSELFASTRHVRPTDAQLLQIGQYDAGLYKVGMDAILRHLHYFLLPFSIFTNPSSNTKTSLGQVCRIPYMAVAGEVGCEAAAASVATAKFEKALAAAPTSFATLTTSAAIDIKTGAGTFQAASILDGSETFEAGDIVRLSATGDDSTVTGAQGQLHCFRT